MREVTYKNLTSVNSRKKDICLREIFEKDGVTARTERRCFYFVRDITHFNDPDDIQRWLSKHSGDGVVSKRQFHIFKQHVDEPSVDKLICKVIGNFYAVSGNSVYTVAFLQSFKVLFSKKA